MEKKIQEVIIPFEWSGWDEIDILMNSYYNVKFTDDFGNFKKDEEFSSITVDYQKGLVEGYNDDGSEVAKSQKFKCTPIE